MVAVVVFYLASYLMDPLHLLWDGYHKRSVRQIIFDELTAVFFCIIVAELSMLIDRLLDRYLPWKTNMACRLGLQSVLQIFGGALAVFLIGITCFDGLSLLVNIKSNKELTGIAQLIASNIAVALAISAINTAYYFLENWNRASIEATEHQLRLTQLKQAATAAELQALKLQIDPHFIFNNLSVLSELILENQQLGYEYSENFSKVYRYLLLNSKRDWIRLEEELKFLKSYIFLIQKRIGEGIVFDLTIADESMNYLIPPMTLQLLVENIIKHNQTTRANPLKVRVCSEGPASLLVENTKIALINKPESSGIGLENILHRYSLLTTVAPEIRDDPGCFRVIVPLIEP